MKKITFNLNIVLAFMAVVLFVVFLTLAISSKAQDMSSDILKQQEIIDKAQNDFDKGVIGKEEYLKIIQKAEEEIDILKKQLGGGEIAPGLSGYAWSENVGWISFRGVSADGVSYQVVLTEDNFLSGYAWSPNIGWIKFDRYFVDPINNSFDQGARYDKDTGKITGWAQVESFNNDGECVPAGSICSNNFADGWISFNGTTKDGGEYGVTFESDIGVIKGFGGGSEPALDIPERWAWGGEVIGWIDMGGVTLTSVESSPALLDLTVNYPSVYVGTQVTLSWSSPDGSIDPNGNCSTSVSFVGNGSSSNWSYYNPSPAGGSLKIDPLLLPTTYTFGITCDGLGNRTPGSGYVNVYVNSYPVPTMTLGSSCSGGAGTGVVTLNSASNFSAGSHSCVSSPVNYLWSTLPSVGSSKNNLANGTYTLTCTDVNTMVSSLPVSVNVSCPIIPEPPIGGGGNKIPNYIEN